MSPSLCLIINETDLIVEERTLRGEERKLFRKRKLISPETKGTRRRDQEQHI